MSDNELLLAISAMMDRKLKAELQPIKNEIQSMKEDMDNLQCELNGNIQSLQQDITKVNLTLENKIIPRLSTIESCYMDTYKRYQSVPLS